MIGLVYLTARKHRSLHTLDCLPPASCPSTHTPFQPLTSFQMLAPPTSPMKSSSKGTINFYFGHISQVLTFASMLSRETFLFCHSTGLLEQLDTPGGNVAFKVLCNKSLQFPSRRSKNSLLLTTYLIPGWVGRRVKLRSASWCGAGSHGGVWESENLDVIWKSRNLGI